MTTQTTQTTQVTPLTQEEHQQIEVVECSHCGSLFRTDCDQYTTDSNGDFYCETCTTEVIFCEHCCRDVNREGSAQVNDVDEIWCSECISNVAYYCDGCFEYVQNVAYTNGNTAICEDCFGERYTICTNCEGLITRDNANYSDGEAYCDDCICEQRSENIEAYNYRPDRLNFLKSENEDPKEQARLFLGFEIEAGSLDSNSEASEVADILTEKFNQDDIFYLKEDSSIPEYGFELVSHPITLKRHKELEWNKVLAKMSSLGMKSHDLGRCSCGLHVHASSSFLRNPKLKRREQYYRWLLVDWFVSKNRQQFEKIARREEVHWSKFKDIEKGIKLKEEFGKPTGSRYKAVNFENSSTVEFRLFRGTLKYETFMATLEIVDCLVRWAKQASISDILADGYSFRTFTKYMLGKDQLYPYAIMYLEQLNLI